MLSGPAYERINDSALQEVIVTDTIPLNPDKDLHKFTAVSYTHLDVYKRQAHLEREAAVGEILVTVQQAVNPFAGSGTQLALQQFDDCLLYTSRCV